MVRNGRSQQLLSLSAGSSPIRALSCKRLGADPTRRLDVSSSPKKEGMVDLQTGKLQAIITICNYGVFQHGGLTGHQTAGNGPAMGQKKKTL